AAPARRRCGPDCRVCLPVRFRVAPSFTPSPRGATACGTPRGSAHPSCRSGHAEPGGSGVYAAGGKAEQADDQPLRAIAECARHRPVTTHRGLQLTLQPALELLDVRERQRLDLESAEVVVATRPVRPDLEWVAALDGGPRVGVRR